ncbi:DHH family phosphoesterase [Kibdelosporangium persicum]|uniref:Bifunctional oligoribonuclease and PAP phosphatase NrnA n=1 Tax=Kibdelosporangium persicum TaxID=2698649 RepID=A0ABX2EX70_9PSEU|nr:DHH family phosphoesterase [Kibdelosporangium persicum]NRN63641.1 Bifunctional oligoribonuclease and PAP phosphatase NrnA [Kibdelosporangium persicum]
MSDLGDIAGAAELLRTATDVTLLAHVNPDADALGSALALGLALHRRGAAVRVSFGSPDTVPETLRPLDYAGLLVPAADVPEVTPLLIALDTGSVERLGKLGDRVASTIAAGGNVLVIDHHASNTYYGTHHVVNEHAVATAALVADVLDALDVSLDAELASCVYAGIVTDSGSFRRATPETHQLAARLLAAGVNPDTTARELMEAHPFAYLPMLSTVLGRARLDRDAAGGRGVVYTYVTLEDSKDVRAEEIESVVDIVRTAREAEVAAVFKEIEPLSWSVSLRSVSEVDVKDVAVAMGGGGHRRAAGYTAEGPVEPLIETLLATLSR